MGICLDTDKKSESEDFEIVDGRPIWHTDGPYLDDLLLLQSNSHITFEEPKIPIIFILGGPGSGKVTHCDNLSEEKQGIIHINMIDLLQQYAIGSGELRDFNQLSSRIVAEVLMLEIKMSPAAKTFIISGYPRNMRDVVEYSQKIKTVNGVILLDWDQSSLERQIEYGAKLGQVILSLARMELSNFYKNVMPVSEFYDQRKILTTINGERNPDDVYKDFRVAVLRIIGSYEENKQNVPVHKRPIPNGKVKTGVGVPKLDSDTSLPTLSKPINFLNAQADQMTTVSVHAPPKNGYPTVVYVIGGPGSNKATLIKKAMKRIPNWFLISIGELLREAVDSRFLPIEEAQNLRDTIAAGEMVEQGLVVRLLDRAMLDNINANGVVIDSFPRDMNQLQDFEDKYDQSPPMILLDCSKLQLSRGRWDDSIPAFRKRLELFRERTLPMLKVIDTEHRLTMVDGDTNTPEVEEAFTLALFDAIQQAEKDTIGENGDGNRTATAINFENAILQDLEEDLVEIRRKSSILNGFGPPRDRGRSLSGRTNMTEDPAPSNSGVGVNTIKTNAQVESYLKP